MNARCILPNCQIRTIFYNHKQDILKTPTASEVLSSYLKQCDPPPPPSFFIKLSFSQFLQKEMLQFCFVEFQYSSIYDDHWGKSHFNWKVRNSNYHILRTGCFPYIKYHCTKRKVQDLTIEDTFFRIIKITNLGIQFYHCSRHYKTILFFFAGFPCLAYGIAAIFLIRHVELVETPKGSVFIYFLYPEDKGSLYQKLVIMFSNDKNYKKKLFQIVYTVRNGGGLIRANSCELDLQGRHKQITNFK